MNLLIYETEHHASTVVSTLVAWRGCAGTAPGEVALGGIRYFHQTCLRRGEHLRHYRRVLHWSGSSNINPKKKVPPPPSPPPSPPFAFPRARRQQMPGTLRRRPLLPCKVRRQLVSREPYFWTSKVVQLLCLDPRKPRVPSLGECRLTSHWLNPYRKGSPRSCPA